MSGILPERVLDIWGTGPGAIAGAKQQEIIAATLQLMEEKALSTIGEYSEIKYLQELVFTLIGALAREKKDDPNLPQLINATSSQIFRAITAEVEGMEKQKAIRDITDPWFDAYWLPAMAHLLVLGLFAVMLWSIYVPRRRPLPTPPGPTIAEVEEDTGAGVRLPGELFPGDFMDTLLKMATATLANKQGEGKSSPTGPGLVQTMDQSLIKMTLFMLLATMK